MILLFSSTGATAQISVLDSNRVVIEKMEFRHIVLTQVRARYLADLLDQTQVKAGILERLVDDRDSALAVSDSSIELLRNQIEEQEPSWLDRFIIGYPLGVVTVVAGLLFLR